MSDDTDATRPSTSLRGPTLRRPGQLTLHVLTGPSAGRVAVISKSRVVVGRSRTADIVLDHFSVSGAHFELRIGSQGIEVRDLNSINGIRIGQIGVMHAIVGLGTVISAGDCDVQIAGIDEVEVLVSAEGRLGGMLGSSKAMREVFAQVRQLAKTPLDVLVTGETGTGKELVSQALHALSKRAEEPFVTIDCGTLARNLYESAIFGYRRGAFTGAESDSSGFVEDANGGTLFIDEIGELPLDLQVKFLRVLDRREVIRLGETRARAVDVKVIAATNRDLEKMVAEGQFREDLYYRLSRARMELPPLRHREDDILELAQSFLDEVARERDISLTLSEPLKSALMRHPWPGNVRELRGVIQHAAHVAACGEIGVNDVVLGGSVSIGQMDRLYALPYREAHQEFDRVYLVSALKEAKGSAAACARKLVMSRTTLRRRFQVLGISSIE